MHILWLFDNISDLLKQILQLSSIFVFLTWIKYETYPFKTFDPLLVLLRLTCEITTREWNLIQILEISLIILIHRHNPIDNLWPIIESVHIANKEVVLVEYLQNFMLQIFDEENSSPLENIIKNLWGTLSEDHVT
jgi:hypothetical protein